MMKHVHIFLGDLKFRELADESQPKLDKNITSRAYLVRAQMITTPEELCLQGRKNQHLQPELKQRSKKSWSKSCWHQIRKLT